MRDFRDDVAAIYRSAWQFALACPWLFLVPVLVEGAQHFAELSAGMYLDRDHARLAEGDSLRMQLGYLKTLALLLPGYWFTRYVMFDGDRRRAASLEMPAIALFLLIFLLGAAMTWLGLFGPSAASLFGLPEGWGTPVAVGLALAEQVAGLLLAALVVAWPLGNAAIGPMRSARIMSCAFWHALGLAIAGILPLMVVHYAFAIVAVLVLPPMLDWAAMALDAVVVGYLALTMTAATVFAARRAAKRAGTTLLPLQSTPTPND